MRWGKGLIFLGALLLPTASLGRVQLEDKDGFSVAWFLAACESTDKATHEKKCEHPLETMYMIALVEHEHPSNKQRTLCPPSDKPSYKAGLLHFKQDVLHLFRSHPEWAPNSAWLRLRLAPGWLYLCEIR